MFKVNQDRIFSPDDVKDKREELLIKIVDSIKHVTETSAGYQLDFAPENEDLILVSDWIQAERMCNPFLRFLMRVESNHGPLSCELGGPEGTKPFLASTLGLNRWI